MSSKKLLSKLLFLQKDISYLNPIYSGLMVWPFPPDLHTVIISSHYHQVQQILLQLMINLW